MSSSPSPHEPPSAEPGALVPGTESGAPAATDAPAAEAASATRTVRHRTERDATGRVWRFVYDPAAQDTMATDGMVRVRCTTGNARASLVVRADWLEWPRQQLLDELASALRLQRGGGATTTILAPSDPTVSPDRRLARRRLVRDARGTPWNCVYDPSLPANPDDGDRVRVRCSAGRDRIELVLEASWHRLGDRQLADLIAVALEARRK